MQIDSGSLQYWEHWFGAVVGVTEAGDDVVASVDGGCTVFLSAPPVDTVYSLWLNTKLNPKYTRYCLPRPFGTNRTLTCAFTMMQWFHNSHYTRIYTFAWQLFNLSIVFSFLFSIKYFKNT